MASQSQASRFTARAVVLGGVVSLLMAFGSPYSRYVLGTTPLVFTSFAWGVMATWIVVVFANAVGGHWLSLWRPLSSWELLIVFIIGTVGSSMTTTEVAGLLVTNIAGLNYYASPENRWIETFGHLLPQWVIVPDTNHAVKWLFDGTPEGGVVVWFDWAMPLFWNLSFAAAMYAVQFSVVALFRRQWVENERLNFPILQVPIELAKTSEDGGWAPPWLRSKLFWVGFSIPFGFLALQAGHWFWPIVPQIPTDLGFISFGREYPAIPMRLFWPIVGISYFANTEIVFSLWFFKLIGTIAAGLVIRLGLVATAGAQPMHWLNTGALIVMVLWLMWQARRHLRQAALRALGRDDTIDDSNELISYRTAYAIVVAGLAFMLFWLIHLGMSIPVALTIIAVSQIIYIGIARLAFEAGVIHVNAPLNPCHIVAESIGVTNLAPASLAAIALTYWKFTNIKSLFLVTMGHAAAISPPDQPQSDAIRRRPLAPIIAIALTLTTGLAIWYTMHLGYTWGGYNFDGWVFRGAAQEPYLSLDKWLTDPKAAEAPLSFAGVGAALMALFTALRYLFVWWPLHPIGLAVCFSYHISHSFLSFLIAWTAKTLVLKIGGIGLYRQFVPLFLGILVGSFTGGAICFGIDYVWFPLEGHTVFYR